MVKDFLHLIRDTPLLQLMGDQIILVLLIPLDNGFEVRVLLAVVGMDALAPFPIIPEDRVLILGWSH